jgi:hypothetical protein
MRVPEQGGCLDRISLESRSTLPYYRNYSLLGGTTVTRAVVVIHGINRNAQDYFHSINRAATNVGVTDNTMIVAPHFQIEEDERKTATHTGRTQAGTRGKTAAAR